MAATPYVPTIVVDDVIDALKAFLQPFVGSGTPIIRGQQNRVPPPVLAFVKLTEIFKAPIETPTFENDGTNLQAKITTPTKIDIQVDFYGIDSGDWAQAVQAVFRSPYTPQQFSAGISPLYSSDARQVPLVTGEEQYEFRWVITASLQYNPSVYVPQQSATELRANTFEDLP